MAQSESKARDPIVTFRVQDEDKRRLMRMRAAQLGFENRSAYLRSLVDNDLGEADLPDLE
jgi:hypothetical protein